MKLTCCVLLAALTILAPQSFAVMEWYDINTKTVTTLSTDTPGLYHYVDVDGTWMTWCSQPSLLDFEVIACDLTTGTTYNLTNDPGSQRGCAISGNTVIWRDFAAGDDIVAYNLATHDTYRWTPSIPYVSEEALSISGSNVIYRNANNIMLYDLSTQTESTLVSGGWYGSGMIGGDLAVYSDWGIIGAKNIVTGDTYDNIGYGWKGLSTDGDKVMWWEGTMDGQYTLNAYDVLSGQTNSIFTGYYQLWDDTTDVDNGRAVYTWAGSIYMYDFASQETSLIRECWMAEDGTMINYTSPRISGDIIVWDPPAASVPEPLTLTILGAGGLLAAGYRRKRV
jgi:beta propeller repeat protein